MCQSTERTYTFFDYEEEGYYLKNFETGLSWNAGEYEPEAEEDEPLQSLCVHIDDIIIAGGHSSGWWHYDTRHPKFTVAALCRYCKFYEFDINEDFKLKSELEKWAKDNGLRYNAF